MLTNLPPPHYISCCDTSIIRQTDVHGAVHKLSLSTVLSVPFVTPGNSLDCMMLESVSWSSSTSTVKHTCSSGGQPVRCDSPPKHFFSFISNR